MKNPRLQPVSKESNDGKLYLRLIHNKRTTFCVVGEYSNQMEPDTWKAEGSLSECLIYLENYNKKNS